MRAAASETRTEPESRDSSARITALIAALSKGTHHGERAAALGVLRRQLEETLVRHVQPLVENMMAPSDEVVGRLIAAGGKRVRPVLSMLCAGAVGGAPEAALPVAVSVELLHTGTLLHDDVIDEGERRRGTPAARVVWGNASAVLSGDFCFFASLEALLATGDLELVSRSVRVARQMVRGELLQLQRRQRRDPAMDLVGYDEVITLKTAELIAFATWGGGWLGMAGPRQRESLQVVALDRYGAALGMAFQIVDDILDYTADAEVLGKAVGGDLREGVITLPLLYAMEDDAELKREVTAFIAAGPSAVDDERVGRVAALTKRVCASRGIDRARDRALALTSNALEELGHLPASVFRDGLAALGVSLADRVR